MDKFDRLQLLQRTLRNTHRVINIDELMRMTSSSKKVIENTIEQLRSQYRMDIFHDRHRKGYRLIRDDHTVELPGLWFTVNELQALTACLHVALSLNQGMHNSSLKMIDNAVHELLASKGVDATELTRKIKYIPQGHSEIDPHVFGQVCQALINGNQLYIKYKDYHQQLSERYTSPQQLVYYKEDWYLDAYCEERKALRTFHLSRISFAFVEDTNLATPISPEDIDQHYKQSYGLFAGPATHLAKIKFTGSAATEVASQQWHASQVGEWQGREYYLSVPYGQPYELIRHILQFGARAKVIEPQALKDQVVQALQQAISAYD